MEGTTNIPKARVFGEDFHLKTNAAVEIDEHGNVTIETDKETIYSHLSRCTITQDNRDKQVY